MQNSFDKINPAQESSKQKDTSGNGGEGDDDDDDEEEEKAEMENMEAIFEPKDPYALRPLPYVIGSVQFLQSDDVGLLLAESDESGYEDEEEEEEEDDSEAEMEKPMAVVSDDGFSDNLDKDSDDNDSESDEDGVSKPCRVRKTVR